MIQKPDTPTTAYYGFQWKTKKFPMACFLQGKEGK